MRLRLRSPFKINEYSMNYEQARFFLFGFEFWSTYRYENDIILQFHVA